MWIHTRGRCSAINTGVYRKERYLFSIAKLNLETDEKAYLTEDGWQTEHFIKTRIFNSKDEANLALLSNIEKDGAQMYSFRLEKVLDTSSYGQFLDWIEAGDLPGDIIEQCCATYRRGGGRRDILDKYGYCISRETANTIRNQYTKIINAGFGRFYLPDKKGDK